MTFLYKTFSIYLPLLLSIISLILTIFDINGQISSKNLSAETYLMKLDFQNMKKRNLITSVNETLFEINEPHYYDYIAIGLWGYCGSDTPSYEKGSYHCEMGHEAGYAFDLYRFLRREAHPYKSRSNIKRINRLPSDIFVTKAHSLTILAFLFISLISLILLVIYLGVISFIKQIDKPSMFSWILIFLPMLGTVVTGALSNDVYSRVADGYNKRYDKIGIFATLGNKKFYSFIWATLVLQLLALISVIATSCLMWSANRKEKQKSKRQLKGDGLEEDE